MAHSPDLSLSQEENGRGVATLGFFTFSPLSLSLPCWGPTWAASLHLGFQRPLMCKLQPMQTMWWWCDSRSRGRSQVLQTYQRAASAWINWEKCSSFLIGEWQDSTPPVLPQSYVWNWDGFKFLGVYLGTVGHMNIRRWILPKLSHGGRVAGG